MFEQPDSGLSLGILGVLAAATGVRYAYRLGKANASVVPGQRWDQKSLVTGSKACALRFRVGSDPLTGEVTADLVDMPHLLIAGMTGSGKSTFLASMLTDLIDGCPPDELKIVLIDPKRVELAPFADAPHVLTYEWEPDAAVTRLAWAKAEMARRYDALARVGVRKIEESTGMPRVVIVVEEFANLMLSGRKRQVQDLVVTLASTGRAVGMHLVLVTQRPSVDVVTGLIKANVPARVALATVSAVDSRVVLDQSGAEKLHGRGDLLLLRPDLRNLVRLQGRWTSDQEILTAVNKW